MLYFTFLAKAQNEAYKRKKKEKAKQARTQVRNFFMQLFDFCTVYIAKGKVKESTM